MQEAKVVGLCHINVNRKSVQRKGSKKSWKRSQQTQENYYQYKNNKAILLCLYK